VVLAACRRARGSDGFVRSAGVVPTECHGIVAALSTPTISAPLSGIPGCSSVAARAAAGTAARILSTDTAGSVAAAVSASASLAFRLSL